MVLNSMSRPQFVGAWCAAAVVLGACAIVFGADLTIGNAGWWLATCLVPPAILLLIWRGPPPLTVAEVLRAVDTSRWEGH
jgi:hypothetical protein